MTFSLVARSADGTQWGVAVASKFLAAGAFVPDARAGAGAIASQSFVDPGHLPRALDLMAAGAAAHDVLKTLSEGDVRREHRQIGVVDRDGGAAAMTGVECIPWAGSATGDGYTAQGNCLTGPEVVLAVERAFLASGSGTPLPRRLMAGLRAGEAAGGDRRGKQSAGLYVVAAGAGYGGGNDVLVDLRVDDAPEPVVELERLLDLHELYFGKADPEDLLPLEAELADEVRGRLARLGYRGDDLDAVLLAWMGWENYEERHVPGRVDPVVLSALREASP